ncbi:MAG TPA: hypothetical protein PLV42_00345 [bacterium]|nr:hypothetical protein [bacterium]
MMKMFFAALLFVVLLFAGCAKKEAVDVNSFPTDCLKNCAMAFNGCMSLAKSPDAEKQCDNYFTKCKNECEAKVRPAPTPAPAAEPTPAPAPAPATTEAAAK